MAITGLSFGKLAARSILSLVRDVVVPPLCLVCDRITSEPGGCCSHCWSKIRFVTDPLCDVTGKPFSHAMGEGILSAEAIADPPPFTRCRSAVLYDDTVRRLVSGFKYSDRTDLGPWMANWMAVAGRELLADRPVLVPVPLHASRLLQRRYNQSAELARHISKKAGLSHRPDWLIRSKPTRQQVGLSALQRKKNVQGAFRVPQSMALEISGARILLVDDVYTSGATIKSAARALLRAGAARVDVLTFARVETLEALTLYS